MYAESPPSVREHVFTDPAHVKLLNKENERSFNPRHLPFWLSFVEGQSFFSIFILKVIIMFHFFTLFFVVVLILRRWIKTQQNRKVKPMTRCSPKKYRRISAFKIISMVFYKVPKTLWLERRLDSPPFSLTQKRSNTHEGNWFQSLPWKNLGHQREEVGEKVLCREAARGAKAWC